MFFPKNWQFLIFLLAPSAVDPRRPRPLPPLLLTPFRPRRVFSGFNFSGSPGQTRARSPLSRTLTRSPKVDFWTPVMVFFLFAFWSRIKLYAFFSPSAFLCAEFRFHMLHRVLLSRFSSWYIMNRLNLADSDNFAFFRRPPFVLDRILGLLAARRAPPLTVFFPSIGTGCGAPLVGHPFSYPFYVRIFRCRIVDAWPALLLP